MDYSPTPNKIKPQYDFLDDSIEMGRSEIPKAYRGSPLKNQKDTETFHQRQKQFYNKYSNMSNSPDLLKEKQKARTGQNYTDTTSRLFKNISDKVPVDDVININSNQIEKIIRENESLKLQLKEEKKETYVLNQYANGIKEKLIKYKKLNDALKQENESLKSGKVEVEKKLESLKSSQTQPSQQQPESPKFNFDPENVEDIFGSNKPEKDVTETKPPVRTKISSFKIEERIMALEDQVSQINTNQDDKFENVKNEIEFLKNLSLQMKQNKNMDDDDDAHDNERFDDKEIKGNQIPKEDDLIVKESLELKELQEQVDLFTKKLQLREDNKLKKYTLNKELEKLAQRLQTDDIPTSIKPGQESRQAFPQEQEEVHTPIDQTFTPSCPVTKVKSANSTSIPTKTTSVRERLSSECKVCNNKSAAPQFTHEKPSSSKTGELYTTTNKDDSNQCKEHVPSFQIGDTVWY